MAHSINTDSKPSASIEELSYITPLVKTLRHGRNSNIAKRISFYGNDEGTVSVNVRIKPLVEPLHEPRKLIYDENSITIKSDKIEKVYNFTYIIPPELDQSGIYEKCAKNKVKRLLNGENAFIFTYGASNSGKTFTAHGVKGNPGLIPRSMVTIFSSLENFIDLACPIAPDGNSVMLMDDEDLSVQLSLKKSILGLEKSLVSHSSKNPNFICYKALDELKSYTDKITLQQKGIYTMWISFYEIYNEKIFDLLSDPQNLREPRQLSTDKDNLPFIKDLIHIRINTLHEAFMIYTYGKHNLSISSTNINDLSSRSHSIFTITVIGRPRGGSADQYFLNSSFSICDMAGTERNNRTNNVGIRLHESQAINKSFLVLNKCLRIIRENQQRHLKKPVPCRESKLTQLLTSVLTSGSTSLSLIVTITQEEKFIKETEGTLQNSSVAHDIKVLPLVRPNKQNKRKSLISLAISQYPRGQPVNWKEIVNNGGNKNFDNGTRSFYPPGHEPDVYKELLNIKIRNKELEERIVQIERTHRTEVEDLKMKIREQQSCQKTEFELRQEIEKQEEELIDIRTQYLSCQKKLRILREEKFETEKLNKELMQLLDDSKEEVEDFQKEIRSLEDDLKSRELALNLKDEQIDMLKSQKLELEEILAQEKHLIEDEINLVTDNEDSPLSSLEPYTKKGRERKKQYVLRKKNMQVPVINIDTASDDESRLGTPNQNKPITRSKSHEAMEDPDFFVPKTRKKTRTAMRSKNKELPDHVAGVSGVPIQIENTLVKTRKLLFSRSSPDITPIDDSRRQDLEQTQVSPGTIISRNLRSGRKFFF